MFSCNIIVDNYWNRLMHQRVLCFYMTNLLRPYTNIFVWTVCFISLFIMYCLVIIIDIKINVTHQIRLLINPLLPKVVPLVMNWCPSLIVHLKRILRFQTHPSENLCCLHHHPTRWLSWTPA